MVRKFLVIKDIKIGIVVHCVSHTTQLITDREVFDRELPVIFIALLSGTQISNTLHRACVANLTHKQEHRSCRRIPTLVMCSDQNSLNLRGGKDN